MTRCDEAIIDECEAWYRSELGFGPLPVPRDRIVFRRTRGRLPWLGGYYTNTLDFPRVLRLSLLAGTLAAALVLVAMLIDAGARGLTAFGAWDTIPTAFLAVAAIVFSYAGIFLRRGKVVVRVDPTATRAKTVLITIHEFAHAYHNTNSLRVHLHLLGDVLLLPLLVVSYTEGIAVWVQGQYCRSRGLDRDTMLHDTLPLRYRVSFRLIEGVEKVLGRRAVVFALRYL